MRKKTKKVIVLIIGIVLVALGLVGLVLPFLQGILFLIIGLILISLYFPEIRPWINKHIERFPHLFAIINKIENWLKKTIGEI